MDTISQMPRNIRKEYKYLSSASMKKPGLSFRKIAKISNTLKISKRAYVKLVRVRI